MGNILQANQQLNTNNQLVSANGRERLLMQGDGNLVLYRIDNAHALWASGTFQKPVTYAVMQGDGNFVCYDPGGKPYWATGTDGHPGAYLTLQDDGNLVVYSANNTPLWASKTVQNWDPMSADTGNENIGTGMWMHSWAGIAATGLISGHTHTWCTVDLRGFHGSVVALLLDNNNKVIWPPNPQVTKQQYGVDGVWIGTHDRTDYWAVQADSTALTQAKSLECVHFYDPKNMLLTDIPIAAKTIAEVIAAIKTVIG